MSAMSACINKTVVKQLIEGVFNRGDLPAIDEAVFPQAAQQFKQSLAHCAALFTACPDFRVIVEDLVAEGELVVCRLNWSGTHTEQSMGMRPTGRRLSGGTTEVFRLAHGKIASCSRRWRTWGCPQLLDSRPPPGVQIDVLQEPVLQ